jgi:hypothetical protein
MCEPVFSMQTLVSHFDRKREKKTRRTDVPSPASYNDTLCTDISYTLR